MENQICVFCGRVSFVLTEYSAGLFCDICAAEKKYDRRGGKRAGSGRKSKYGEKTTLLRVPRTMVEDIENYIQKHLKKRF